MAIESCSLIPDSDRKERLSNTVTDLLQWCGDLSWVQLRNIGNVYSNLTLGNAQMKTFTNIKPASYLLWWEPSGRCLRADYWLVHMESIPINHFLCGKTEAVNKMGLKLSVFFVHAGLTSKGVYMSVERCNFKRIITVRYSF